MQSELCSTFFHTLSDAAKVCCCFKSYHAVGNLYYQSCALFFSCILSDAESVLFKLYHAVGGDLCSQSCALLFATH